MSDIESLNQCRVEFNFSAWTGMVPDHWIDRAEACIRETIDSLIGLGSSPRESDVRAAVEACVERFNELEHDRPWIMTTEREDIYEALDRIVELTGVECEDFDDWFWNANW